MPGGHLWLAGAKGHPPGLVFVPLLVLHGTGFLGLLALLVVAATAAMAARLQFGRGVRRYFDERR